MQLARAFNPISGFGRGNSGLKSRPASVCNAPRVFQSGRAKAISRRWSGGTCRASDHLVTVTAKVRTIVLLVPWPSLTVTEMVAVPVPLPGAVNNREPVLLGLV